MPICGASSAEAEAALEEDDGYEEGEQDNDMTVAWVTKISDGRYFTARYIYYV